MAEEFLIGNIKGADAKITEVTASVDESTGTPAVSVEMGGTESERSFHFSFSGLKGETGQAGAEGKITSVDVNKLTPTYTESESLTELSSGEALSVAFGKIKKAISSLISHITDTTKHITSAERTAWNSKANVNHTHTASEVGVGTPITYGTYTGTGVFGVNNPNTIPITSKTQMIILTGGGYTISFIRGVSSAISFGYLIWGRNSLTWSDNSLSWYTDEHYTFQGGLINGSGNASTQLNASGVVYSYIIIEN